MSTAEFLIKFREQNHLTQEEFARKAMVTRQAVSRWEQGKTVPSTDTLKIISKAFGVSANEILGQPQNTVCQVCGSPLEAGAYSREKDGTVNENYCKWCYIEGVHKYHSPEEVIADVIPRWHWGTPEQMADWLRKQLQRLDYWQKD